MLVELVLFFILLITLTNTSLVENAKERYKEIYGLLKQKWVQLHMIYSLAPSTSWNTKWTIFKYFILYFCKLLWFLFLEQIRNKVEYKKDVIIVTYYVNGEEYKIIQKKHQNPEIVEILDEDGNDVYDLVRPYFGPTWDHSHLKLTPSFFGKCLLCFVGQNGEYIYADDEIIDIPLKPILRLYY
jgi:hypothetical protein